MEKKEKKKKSLTTKNQQLNVAAIVAATPAPK